MTVKKFWSIFWSKLVKNVLKRVLKRKSRNQKNTHDIIFLERCPSFESRLAPKRYPCSKNDQITSVAVAPKAELSRKFVIAPKTVLLRKAAHTLDCLLRFLNNMIEFNPTLLSIKRNFLGKMNIIRTGVSTSKVRTGGPIRPYTFSQKCLMAATRNRFIIDISIILAHLSP